MTKIPRWVLLPVILFLVACPGQTPAPGDARTAVPTTADSPSLTSTPANTTFTPSPQVTPESMVATGTATPVGLVETATSIPNRGTETPTPTPATRLATSLQITVDVQAGGVVMASRSNRRCAHSSR